MYQVAIIGVGQLGRRHLQGLIKSNQPIVVHIVDPFEASRRAVEDFIASSAPDLLPAIFVHDSIDKLPRNLELVVVATTANQRLEVIEKLTRFIQVRHLILEKFLFNDSDHYAQAAALIAKHGITAWVNTPRRHFGVYRDMLTRSRGDRLLQFTVDGGEWGLCCNSVHFIDLVQFLTGETELFSLQTHFDDDVMESKRSGYVELTGEISGQVGSTRFTVRSVRGSSKPISIALHYEKKTVFIAESTGMLWEIGEGPVVTESFRIPYQSEMTGIIADQLLTTSGCDLTPYADSAAAHLSLLRIFSKAAGTMTATRAWCEIT